MNPDWLSNYDLHVPRKFTFPDISVCDLLKKAANQNPNGNALLWDENYLTYRELDKLSSHMAFNLNKIGLGLGDRIGIAFANTPEFVISFFGVLKSGSGVSAINPYLTPVEQISQLKTIEANALLTDQMMVKNIREEKLELPQSIRRILVRREKQDYSRKTLLTILNSNPTTNLTHWEDLLPETFIDVAGVQISPNMPAIYQFTGGTTGIPKAAIGLHRNLVVNTYQFKTWCDLEQQKQVIIAAIPLYHVYGMVLGMSLSVCLQSPLVLIKNPRDISNILINIEKHSVTFFPGVPNLFNMINQHSDFLSKKYNLHSLKRCISGAAPLNENTAKIFQEVSGCPLLQGYGLSEAPTATHCNPVYGKNKINSIGMPLPGVDCRIVDLERGIEDLLQGQPGELLIRAPQVMSGYYKKEQESLSVIKDGWLYTGDVVTVDHEGYFYFRERKKDLIKVGGFQVWPNEVEEVLRNIDGIIDVAVAGVLEAEEGEKAIAWIVLTDDFQFDELSLKKLCKEKLASYKVPEVFISVREIPRTSTGKVLRRILVDNYLKQKKTPV